MSYDLLLSSCRNMTCLRSIQTSTMNLKQQPDSQSQPIDLSMDSIGKRFGTVSNTERFQPLAAEVTTQTSKRLDRACHQTSPLCHKRVTNVYNKNSSSKNMTKTRGQTHLGAGRRRHVSLISTQSKSIEIRLFGL